MQGLSWLVKNKKVARELVEVRNELTTRNPEWRTHIDQFRAVVVSELIVPSWWETVGRTALFAVLPVVTWVVLAVVAVGVVLYLTANLPPQSNGAIPTPLPSVTP